jgi:dTDP-6-deoxy-L-talose 4-dehydrogenase (NAD+)
VVRRADAVLPEGCVPVVGSLAQIPWDAIERFAPETVLHLAWIATPGSHFHSPENQEFVRWSDALFRGLLKLGVRNLAGTGTFIEYATSERPLVEDVSALVPLYSYSRAKIKTLENLKIAAKESDAAWTWFRVFNAYGEGEARSRMISATLAALGAGASALIRTPDSVRDFIHVSDVVHGMLLAIETGLHGAVNIGTGCGTRVFDLALLAADACGAPRSLVQRAEPLDHDTMPVAIADAAKLRSTGWRSQMSLKDGLERLWTSLRN